MQYAEDPDPDLLVTMNPITKLIGQGNLNGREQNI